MKRKVNFWLATTLCALLAALGAACKAGDGAQRAGATATTSGSDVAVPGTGATPHPTSTPNDNVRRITVEEAQAMAARGEAVIVDVRPKLQYDQSRIKGSLSLPRNEINQRLPDLPKDKLIIFYCA